MPSQGKSEHERITALESVTLHLTDAVNDTRQALSRLDACFAAADRAGLGPAVQAAAGAAGGPINVAVPRSPFTGRGCRKKRVWTRQPDRAGDKAQVTVTVCNDTTREMDVTTSDGQTAQLEGWEKASPEGRPPVIVPDCHVFVGDIRWIEIHFKGAETDRGSGTVEGTITWF